MIAILSVVYEEPDPETYRGVEFSFNGKRCMFAIGTPENDYGCALALADSCRLLVYHSSSVDHFVMDGGDLGMFN